MQGIGIVIPGYYNQYIMGNQLLKGYTIQGEPIAGVGCEKIWRIYQGQKQNTNTMATIFALQKRALPKSQREELIQFAKREAMSLARIRHPGVLAISEALIEDQQILAFSTEQVIGNLSMLAKQNRLKQIISNEIELRLNLFPLLDTIQFLHQNVKTVHLGINFDNIYITKEGKWKISGFSNSQIHGSEGLEDIKSFRCSNYYFCAPEVATQKKFQKKSDIYSFGILILDLMLILSGKYEPKAYRTQSEYSQNFESELLKKINSDSLQKIETYKELKLLLKNVFAREPQKRTSLHELSSSKWLNDKLVLTVRYLQNITNYDNKQQIQFLKGLLGVLNHFEPKILLRKVLPLLLDLLKFKHLIPSVIYICLETMKNGKIITEQDFREKVWPSFKRVVQGKEMTAHSLYLFVDNMEKIEKVIGLQQLTQSVIPLYVKCFDCPTKLKELALYKTDYILNKMDYQFVKTKMIPKVMGCIKDQNPQVHKKSLIALKKSIKILDTQTITSIVLPGLEACKKSGSDPFINAITVAIYTMLGKTLPSETLCSKLIPTILPYLSDPNVGPQDFYNYKTALLTMIEKIQSQRKKFWDDSQMTQGPGFTEKDFEFEDENKKSGAVQSNIGKGDYNFLSNYNSNSQAQEHSTEQQQKVEVQSVEFNRREMEFNFSSPWNFDQSSKTQPMPQPVATLKSNASISSPKHNPYNQPKQTGATNLGISPGQGRGAFNTQQSWIPAKNQFSVNVEPKQVVPKLKGPEGKTKRNQNQYEIAADPWSTIQINDNPLPSTKNDFYSSHTAKNSWEYSTFNSGPSITPSNNITTFNSNTSKGSTLFGGSGDPFADIQKGNSLPTSNFNNQNQFLFSSPQSMAYSSPGVSYGNMAQTTMNLGNSFNSFGFSSPQSGTSDLNLGTGFNTTNKQGQQSSSSNSFDLI